MTSSFGSCIFQFSLLPLLLLFFILSFSNAQSPSPIPSPTPRPTSIVFDTEYDPLTLQFMININQGTPLAPVKLVLDLGGKLPWLRCDKGYTSSSYKPVNCTSSKCAQASKHVTCVLCKNSTEPNKTWCHNNACSIHTRNPVTKAVGHGELITDLVTARSNPGSSQAPGPLLTPRRFAFGCATSGEFSLRGLAKGAQGVAGLGRSSVLSLVSQFSAGFRLSRIFALELGTGKIFFGGGPYFYTFGSDFIDLRESHLWSDTPLLTNPKSPEEYFIDVKSIKIYNVTVPNIDKRLLSINKVSGVGGTKVDFQAPYTVLQTSIYKAIAKVHMARYKNATRVPPVAPFSTCYKASTMDVPEWILEGNRIPHSIVFLFGKGGMSTVSDLKWMGDDIRCLSFIDGGLYPKTSIVLGEYNFNGFLEFDISRSRFGFLQPLFP
ncbi:basic 7S globulin 2-like [Papaver somniferum]|uniref:basic 7S globulin 2-like n=1 Tax=Papaver somniferum TaxID=3469 RepID=UPI000E6F53C2|nr:basic 7S globulin 2-like [Papaver somniferum]